MIDKQLLTNLNKHIDPQKNVTYVCIGTDRVIFDSLAPMVGEILKLKQIPNIRVYGTIQHPLHALNIETFFTKYYKPQPDEVLICIDASICNSVKRKNKIVFRTHGVSPGAGVGKTLGTYGDYSIIANVGSKNDPRKVLRELRMNDIYTLAKQIANTIEQFEKQRVQ